VAPYVVILVDSDILIAHLRGLDAARDWLIEARREGPLAISVVSITEIVGGMRSAERREAWQLLAAFRAEPATELIARRAGDFRRQYRRSHSGIGLGDYLIAATADVKGYQPATLNVRHFPMFKQLRPPFTI
jgi:predicted nucleic acid-binding protein